MPGRKTIAVQTAGVAAMAGCAVLWSTSGLFIKLLDWQPFAIAGTRSAIASVVLWIVIGKPRFTFSFDQVVSALAYAATMTLFVIANKHTTAANAILLQYGAPVYVAVLGSMMLKEKPRIEHWLALLAILGGMILFFLDSLTRGNLLGDLVATLTGFTFALNIVMLRKQKDARPLDALLMGNILTALIGGAISLFLATPKLSAGSLLAIAELGIVQIGIASILFAYGIKRITALESILTAVLEPLFSPLWVFLVVGEVPGRRAVMGGIVIIGAVVGSSLVSIRRNARLVK